MNVTFQINIQRNSSSKSNLCHFHCKLSNTPIHLMLKLHIIRPD